MNATPTSKNASATNSDLAGLVPLINALRSLPAVSKRLKPDDLHVPSVTCRCNHTRKVTEMVVASSPLVKRVETNVCLSCPNKAELRKEDAASAHFVCLGCGSVLVRVPPHTNKETGMRIQPGKIYHTLGCPNCRSEVRAAVVDALRQDADPAKVVEFESKILEVLLVTNPKLAKLCLAKVLSPNL
jgi:hypothetical protein